MSLDAIIIGLVIVAALGFLGYRYYKQLKSPPSCGCGCKCGDKLKKVKNSHP